MKYFIGVFFLLLLNIAFSQNPLNAYGNVTAISGTFELGSNTANGLYKVVFVMEGVKYTSSLIIQ